MILLILLMNYCSLKLTTKVERQIKLKIQKKNILVGGSFRKFEARASQKAVEAEVVRK